MNQLPQHLFAKSPRKSVCQDAAKIIEPKLDDTRAIFVAAVALQNRFPLFNKFSRNPGSMPKTYSHVLSTWGKYIYGRVPRKKLWGVLREYGVDGCLLLAVK